MIPAIAFFFQAAPIPDSGEAFRILVSSHPYLAAALFMHGAVLAFLTFFVTKFFEHAAKKQEARKQSESLAAEDSRKSECRESIEGISTAAMDLARIISDGRAGHESLVTANLAMQGIVANLRGSAEKIIRAGLAGSVQVRFLERMREQAFPDKLLQALIDLSEDEQSGERDSMEKLAFYLTGAVGIDFFQADLFPGCARTRLVCEMERTVRGSRDAAYNWIIARMFGAGFVRGSEVVMLLDDSTIRSDALGGFNRLIDECPYHENWGSLHLRISPESADISGIVPPLERMHVGRKCEHIRIETV